MTHTLLEMETITFDYKRLSKAISTRDHSYRLLMWISEAIGDGLIQPSRVAHHSTAADAAAQWFRDNYFNIPESLRPAEDELYELAAFFSTYLTSSFDVIEKPGTKGIGSVSGAFSCRCDLCMRIVNAPHLRAKKLYSRDKQRADFLMVESLCELAKRQRLEIDIQFAEQLVDDKRTRRQAAYITYGYWLIQRLEGVSDGPAVLALWRIIAWDRRGGIRRDFRLKLEDFRAAEAELISTIRSAL